MSAPAVSIVMPTFDRLELLEQAIRSVLGQTMSEWELVVADDGSGSAVQAFLADFERREHERVRVIRLEHSGNAGHVRNCAIAQARAPYIAFMDSDDLWEANKLERQLAALAEAPECRWSYTAFVIVDALGAPHATERTRPWTPHAGHIFEHVVRTTASINTSTVLAATELVREVGGFDTRIDCAEDYDLWLRLALRSPVRTVDEPLVHVRRYAGNTPRAPGKAHEARDYSLRKLAEEAAGPQRALLEAERMRNALARARAIAAAGESARAVAALGQGLRLGWRFPAWWYGAARILVSVALGARR